jgi:hypothetical protein
MTKITGNVKDLVVNSARDIKGGKKTAAQRQAEFDKFLRDKVLTDAEYWNVN